MGSQEQQNKSRVVKVDSVESWDFYVNQAKNQGLPEVASKMEVTAMPTFVLMKDVSQVDKIIGANPEEMRKRIESLVQPTRVYVA